MRGFDDLRSNGTTRDFLDYRVARNGCSSPRIKRGGIVVPCRGLSGAIVGLHNLSGDEWYTQPKPHFANIRRAFFLRQIEVFATTQAADIAAVTNNIAAIGLNGQPWAEIKRALGKFGLAGVRLVDHTELSKGVAA
ncbi:MAG: hypothetical protein ABR568_13980 [Pyrinomonadaceae bacterium]